MNNNQRIDEVDLPDWASEIVNRHDLGLRTDGSRSTLTVLLFNAADILREASVTAFSEAVVSTDVDGRVRDALAMVSDAISLAVLYPREPAPGMMTELKDETVVREDALGLDLSEDI